MVCILSKARPTFLQVNGLPRKSRVAWSYDSIPILIKLKKGRRLRFLKKVLPAFKKESTLPNIKIKFFFIYDAWNSNASKAVCAVWRIRSQGAFSASCSPKNKALKLRISLSYNCLRRLIWLSISCCDRIENFFLFFTLQNRHLYRHPSEIFMGIIL